MKSSWKRLWMLVSVLVLVGGIAACGNDDDETPDDAPEQEIYFYNSEEWADVYAYSEDVDALSEEPGVEAEEEGDDWFSVTVNRDVLSDPMDITFNNGDGEEGESTTIDHPRRIFTSVRGDIKGSEGGIEDLMNATLYFYNSEGWDNVHVQSDDVDALNDNPEADVDSENDGWYEVTVEKRNLTDDPVTVTFNDGTVDNGTSLLVDNHDETYLTIEEEGVYSSMKNAESAISGVATDIYFYNEAEWENVYAWAWNDDGDIFEEWPGEAAEPVEDRDGWWVIELPGIESTDALEIIFNNESDQTDDTPIDGDDVYLVYEGADEVASTYGSFDEAESGSEQVTSTVWFYNDQGWDNVEASASTPDETLLDDEAATQDGSTNWWSVDVPTDIDETSFDIEFSDGDGNTGDSINLDSDSSLYRTADADVSYEGRTQVYFNNEDDWSDVYADVETDVTTPEAFLTDVDAHQEDDTDWYMADIPVNFGDNDYEITFHDGDSNEAEAASLTEDGDRYFTMTEDESYSTLNQAEAWRNTADEDFLTVYFYNSEDWDVDDMNAYNYSTVDDLNEIMGAWPGMSVEQDTDDSDWVTVDVPVELADLGDDDEFYMIFNDPTANDGDGAQTGDILLENDTDVYLAYNGNTYADKASAEEAMVRTEVSFYNTEEWDTVYADAETTDETVLDGAEATQDGDTDWWTVEVPADITVEDFDITFHDGDGNEATTTTLTDGDPRVLTMDGISEYETPSLTELYYEADTSDYTEIYFYNSSDWTNVNGYFWEDLGDDETEDKLGGWPGSPAIEDDSDADWLYVGGPWDLNEDDYLVIFNSDDGQTENIDLKNMDTSEVYIALDGGQDGDNYTVEIYDSKSAAEDAVAQ